MQHRYNIYFR